MDNIHMYNYIVVSEVQDGWRSHLFDQSRQTSWQSIMAEANSWWKSCTYQKDPTDNYFKSNDSKFVGFG